VLYPSLEPKDFTARWGGKLAMTRDHLPRLVTPEEGLHAAYGCNGRGVALMTMLGKLAAMRIAGEEPRDLPIAELPPAYYSLYALRVPAMLAARQFRHYGVRSCGGEFYPFRGRWRPRTDPTEYHP
jgi:hypothetical protein